MKEFQRWSFCFPAVLVIDSRSRFLLLNQRLSMIQQEIPISTAEVVVSFIIEAALWFPLIAGLSYALFRLVYRGEERVTTVAAMCVVVTAGLFLLGHSGQYDRWTPTQRDLPKFLGAVIAAVVGALFWGKSKANKSHALPPSPPDLSK